MHTITTRTQQGTTPVTDDVHAWLERTYPEGDAYVVHDETCDAATCGDECEGGCPVYVEAEESAPGDAPRPLLEVLAEHVAEVTSRRLTSRTAASSDFTRDPGRPLLHELDCPRRSPDALGTPCTCSTDGCPCECHTSGGNDDCCARAGHDR